MANRIPRAATKLEVTFLTKTTAGAAGTKMIASKTENGWKGEHNGKSYHLFPSHLRNDFYCKIKVL